MLKSKTARNNAGFCEFGFVEDGNFWSIGERYVIVIVNDINILRRFQLLVLENYLAELGTWQ